MNRFLLLTLAWLIALSPLVHAPSIANGAAAPDPGRPTAVEPAAQAQGGSGEIVPGRYIVVFRDDAPTARSARGLRRTLDISIERQFTHVVDGFSAELTPDQVRQLRQDDAVAFVEPVRTFAAHAKLPTGVDRIGADTTRNHARPPRPGAPVAVLDSGIGPHPALNVVGGHNCMGDGTPSFGDNFGHGTHVAGIIGAIGARPGVAPGTPLFAIKVLDSFGVGDTETVICGLEWVAANHDTFGIAVANLSLGAPDNCFGGEDPTCTVPEDPANCASSVFHTAICNLAVDEGVVIVTSAGNENQDARTVVPAKYDQVITVGAMTDTDGCRGGKGPHSSWGRRDRDDRKWIWSNHGPAVDVVAPGVDITSTLPGGRYGDKSGTSMAAPHIAAAIALGWNPATGWVQRGIPGFPQAGLVLLSGHISCGGAKAESMTVPRKTVPPGGKLTVRLTNFEPRERVRVRLGARLLGVIRVNANGAGRKRFTVPGEMSPGAYKIRARGNDGSSDTERIRIQRPKRRSRAWPVRGNVAGSR